jgi:uncharacterized membrane protein YdbT with pleckstrin-like domain
MNYVQKVLEPDEKVLHVASLSWTGYIAGLSVLAVTAVLYVVLWAIVGQALWLNIALVVLLLVALALLARAWFERWTTEIAITDKRIILKRGFIRRDTIEMALGKVESVDVSQSLLGRLFDYGDITVRGTGIGFAPLRKIDAPLKFRSFVTAN